MTAATLQALLQSEAFKITGRWRRRWLLRWHHVITIQVS
jgi:hypothetical protein